MTNQTGNKPIMAERGNYDPNDPGVLPNALEVFNDIMESNPDKCRCVDEKTLEYSGVPDMELHKALLKAQEQGKKIKVQRKTIISLAD